MEDKFDLIEMFKNWNMGNTIEVVCFAVGIAVLIWLGV